MLNDALDGISGC